MTRLADINTWIFDLDNTLYPPSCALFDQIAVKMTDYMALRLALTRKRAAELRKTYYQKYGTTLRGLMVEHGMEPHGFLEYVHDIDYNAVPANAALVQAIESLPGRKLIFTAGTRAHAKNVLSRLGCPDHFECVFDIADAEFIPKPASEPYQKFLKQHDVAPEQAIFFEDIAENLLVPRAMGMRTVLVGDHDAVTVPAHVDHVTDNLAEFLDGVSK